MPRTLFCGLEGKQSHLVLEMSPVVSTNDIHPPQRIWTFRRFSLASSERRPHYGYKIPTRGASRHIVPLSLARVSMTPCFVSLMNGMCFDSSTQYFLLCIYTNRGLTNISLPHYPTPPPSSFHNSSKLYTLTHLALIPIYSIENASTLLQALGCTSGSPGFRGIASQIGESPLKTLLPMAQPSDEDRILQTSGERG